MNLLLPMLILSLEMLLTYQFTQSVYPAAIVLIFLYTPFTFRRKKKALTTVFIISAAIILAACVRGCMDLLNTLVVIQLVIQVLQAVCFIYVIAPVKGATRLEIQLKSAANMQLFTLGFVSVYIAYSHHSAPLSPFISSAIGVALLVLLALQIENCVPARIAMALRGRYARFSWVRFGIITLMICSTLTIAGLTAPHLQYGADEFSDWISGLSFGRSKAAGPGHGPGKNRKLINSGPPGRYMVSTRLQLQNSYRINVPHVPDLHVVIQDDPGSRMRHRRIYVKCLSFDSLDNMEWFNAKPRSRLVRDTDDGRKDGMIVFTQYVRNPVTYTICMLASGSRLMPSIPTVAMIEQKVIDQKENGIFASPVSLTNVTHFSYSMTSSDVKWDDLSPGRRSAGTTDPVYTRLPDTELSRKIQALAEQVAQPARSTSTRVELIMEYLRTNCAYSLVTENPQSLHPVDNFLFHERKGHCELFATSFALMLRSIGIPARLGLGYSGGEYDDRNDVYTFFKDNCHAWVEIFLKGYGWVIIDPTPPSSEQVPGSPVLKRRRWKFNLGDYPRLSDLVNIKFPNDENELAGTLKWYEKLPAFMTPTFLVNISMVLTALAFVLILRYTGKKRTASTALLTRHHTPGFFKSFCRHFARQGCRIRRGQTASEYLAELKSRGMVANQCDTMIRYFEETSYGTRARSNFEEEAFRSALRNLPNTKTS